MKYAKSLCVFPVAAFVAWLGGYNFDHRDFGVAYGFVMTCIIAIGVHIATGD